MYGALPAKIKTVALRKESVDRNHVRSFTSKNKNVALRKESVDRNFEFKHLENRAQGSLSARRAWIEITSDVSESEPLAGRSPQGERG